MSVTAPETEARAALKALLTSTFGADTPAPQISDDRLHESLGSKGTRIGTYPVRARPRLNNQLVMESEIVVQYFGRWRKEINPEQKVDPAITETVAERFRRALRTGDPNSGRVWYFELQSLEYPPDPTGNITRFVATVIARGDNPALIETTG